jgi:hypothetical protein
VSSYYCAILAADTVENTEGSVDTVDIDLGTADTAVNDCSPGPVVAQSTAVCKSRAAMIKLAKKQSVDLRGLD